MIALTAARDRAPLKALLQFLHRAVEESRGELAQAKVKRIAETLRQTRYRYFVRIDVQDFYPSINHGAVEAALQRRVDVPQAAELLMAVVRTPTLALSASRRGAVSLVGVPQGLPVSNALAEMVLADVDARFSARDDLAYFRYVDDILILTRSRRHRKIFAEVSAALEGKGLRCHPLELSGSKSTWGSVSTPMDYLGYSIGPDRVSVRAETVARLKSKLALRFVTHKKHSRDRPWNVDLEQWQKLCRQRLEWFLNLSISGCVFEWRGRGWIHYFSLINDFGLLQDLDYFVERKTSSAGLTGLISVKSFLKSFRHAVAFSVDKGGYVPNFDKFTEQQQRDTLALIFRVPEEKLMSLDANQVESLFHRRMRSELDTLETDLALVY